MEYKIFIRSEFDSDLTEELLASYTDELISDIDRFIDNSPRSFIVDVSNDSPLHIIDVNTSLKLDVNSLYDYLNRSEIVYVTILDKKFDPFRTPETTHWWTNAGITRYRDGANPYVDCIYEFHTPSGQEYEIIHIPTYINKFTYRDKQRYENCGATYMWNCTTCWDNFMKATTLDEAIEEFEQIYKCKLWNSVEGYKNGLDDAINALASFDEYRGNKR